MARQIKDSVVVITGASSGIGRASALMFAEQGAKVVVAARNEDALHEVCEACENLGGEALCCPCDVSQEEQVQELANKAVEQFGHIDVWVNNAAVTLFGRFEELPPEAWRKVIETNLFGYVHGARAVLPHFREQGTGVLINVSSVIGKAAAPYVSAYSTSKFAISGFSEALRMELRDSDIKVCTVFPATIDTPLFQHAANYMGKAVKPMPPVYRAEEVAAAIMACARRPRPEIHVGLAGQGVTLPHAVSKRAYDRLMGRQVEREHFQDKPAPPSAGNLYEPMDEWTSVSGNWSTGARRSGAIGTGGMLAMLVPAVLIGYILSTALRPKQRSMLERASRRIAPPSRTKRMARRLAERAGVRERTLGEKISDKFAGISAAVLASGLARHLRKGQITSAAHDLERYGEGVARSVSKRYKHGGRMISDVQKRGGRLFSDVQRRGSDIGHRAGDLGRGLKGSRTGRSAMQLSRRAQREYERRYRPGPIQRVRRALGV